MDGVVVALWHPLGGRRSEQTAYPLDEAHGVLVQYWKAVVSVPERRGRLLVRWEMLNGREHPCRPHLQPVVDGAERRTR